MKKNMELAMRSELMTLADAYEEDIGLDPAPVEAARIFARNKRMFLALEKMVQQLDTVETEGSLTKNEDLKPILKLWIEVNKILSQWSQFSLKYDLDKRRVELEESQARDIVAVILGVVMDPSLQLTNDQITIIRENLGKAMKKLSPKLRPDWASEFDVDVDVNIVDAEEV
jgi:hypothetical protein